MIMSVEQSYRNLDGNFNGRAEKASRDMDKNYIWFGMEENQTYSSVKITLVHS